jgi:hypothetical protein
MPSHPMDLTRVTEQACAERLRFDKKDFRCSPTHDQGLGGMADLNHWLVVLQRIQPTHFRIHRQRYP